MTPVSTARSLYLRFRQLIHEGIKFSIVGLVGVVITDGGTNLLKGQAGMGWLKANIVATLVATAFAFLASRYWTFKDRQRTGVGRETALFFVLNGIGLLIQLACLGFTNYALGMTDRLSSNIALALGIVLGTLFRFWSYRKWVWVAPPVPTADQLAEPALRRPVDAGPRIQL